MNKNKILHILRNPYGHTEDEIRQARLAAADLIERLSKHIENVDVKLDILLELQQKTLTKIAKQAEIYLMPYRDD